MEGFFVLSLCLLLSSLLVSCDGKSEFSLGLHVSIIRASRVKCYNISTNTTNSSLPSNTQYRAAPCLLLELAPVALKLSKLSPRTSTSLTSTSRGTGPGLELAASQRAWAAQSVSVAQTNTAAHRVACRSSSRECASSSGHPELGR